MRANGVSTVRVAFSWAQAQPLAGQPTSFKATDRIVAAAAGAGLAVEPVALYTPSWAVTALDATPDPAAYAAYLAALVARYGPDGTFWVEHPEITAQPIRTWEVWNEPDIRHFWPVHPGWAPPYVGLLRVAYEALHRADPGAVVVAAGLPLASWRELGKLYAAGGGPWFDEANVHPFTRRPADVITILARTRRVMAANGDARKPLRLTEMSWPSSAGHPTHTYGWETTERGQAQRVRQILPLLAGVRVRDRIAAVDWYTWVSPDFGATPDSFGYSGLTRLDRYGNVVIKPALRAWRQTVAALTR